MSDTPFGFRPEGDDEPEPGGGGENAAGGGGLPGFPGFPGFPGLPGLPGLPGAANPADLGAALQQLGRMLQWSGGPVNWDLARDAARQATAAAGDPSVSGTERRAVEDAVRLAELWLDEATTFPSSGGSPRAWSRAEWVEATLPAWKELVEPVAERVGAAMEAAVPAEAVQLAGPLVAMMRQLGVTLWGGQVGQALGTLATEVVGTTDVGLPLAPSGQAALLPANVRAFGEGLGVEERDVYLYLALREMAQQRLHAHAPWLRAHLVGLVDAFARGITVDTSGIEESLRSLDPSRPEALQEALEGGLFEPSATPEQRGALERLETALALVEGWVDDVATQASTGRLPSADALRETVRRRRATGGPAEQTFATLVGLELRPRRLREAAAFWAAVREARGAAGRDAVWAHPDLLPGVDDLGDPAAYLGRDELMDLSALEQDTNGSPGQDSGGAPHDSG